MAIYYMITSRLYMRHGILSKPAVERISTFVPEHANPSEGAIYAFNQALRRFKRVTVITGAGVSTESGIPDYRSAGVGLYARSDRRPMLYSRFVSSSAARRRFWARNYAGWAAFSSAKPNITHQLLAEWQRRGLVGALVTQNVDGLHGKAGGGPVIELHGSAHRVKCLECDWKDTRSAMQKRLRDCNVAMVAEVPELRPDGDVELSEDLVREFVVPPCPNCRGVLIPDIVFFGDSVPGTRVQAVREQVADSDALFVLGSSLQVYSAYRHVLQAAQLGKPVMIVNIGGTRGDRHASHQLDGRVGFVLPRLIL